MLSLIFGGRSKHHNYISKYNALTFKGRLKQFLRKEKYSKGQIVQWGKEEIRIIRFVRWNNCFSECYDFEFVKYPQLGVQQEFIIHEY